MNSRFQHFTLAIHACKFVNSFRHLGHIVSNDQHDDDDIAREIRNLLVRTNILKRIFSRCSVAVKRVLFRSYCLSFYNIGLWCKFTACSLLKFILVTTDVSKHSLDMTFCQCDRDVV